MAANNIKLTVRRKTARFFSAPCSPALDDQDRRRQEGAPDKTLAADSLDIALAPDGATVTSLNAQDKVSLDLPAPKGQASKSIKSTRARGERRREAGPHRRRVQ